MADDEKILGFLEQHELDQHEWCISAVLHRCYKIIVRLTSWDILAFQFRLYEIGISILFWYVSKQNSGTVGPHITLLTVPEKCVVMWNRAMRITTYKHWIFITG